MYQLFLFEFFLSPIVMADDQMIELTKENIKKLNEGEILRKYWNVSEKDGIEIGAGKAMGVVNALPPEIFSAIIDVESYPQFFVRMNVAKKIKTENNTFDFYYEIEMPWPLPNYKCTTDNTLNINEHNQHYRRSWKLKSGTFIRNDGYWDVKPWSENQSLLEYSVIIRPDSDLPQALINYATETALENNITLFRKRMKTLKDKK